MAPTHCRLSLATPVREIAGRVLTRLDYQGRLHPEEHLNEVFTDTWKNAPLTDDLLLPGAAERIAHGADEGYCWVLEEVRSFLVSQGTLQDLQAGLKDYMRRNNLPKDRWANGNVLAGLTPGQRLAELLLADVAAGGKRPTGRRLLQLVGTEVGRGLYGNDLWVVCLHARVQRQLREFARAHAPQAQAILMVVDDVRFENEARGLHAMGAVLCPAPLWRPAPIPAEGTHASESGITREAWESIVYSRGPGGEIGSPFPLWTHRVSPAEEGSAFARCSGGPWPVDPTYRGPGDIYAAFAQRTTQAGTGALAGWHATLSSLPGRQG
jgi:hypothetical protein